MYDDTTVSVSILSSKTRVAPIKPLTIPRLELCGALLTSRLLKASAEDLQVDSSHMFAWTDSSIVLSWLRSSVSRLKVYVANGVPEITESVPASLCRLVPTQDNPADLASRGISPAELPDRLLWWAVHLACRISRMLACTVTS